MIPSSLLTFWLQFHYLKYVALIPLSLIEGPLISGASGLLVRLGVLDFVLAWICLALGEIIGDVVWYWIGYHYGDPFVHRFGKYFGLTESHIEQVKGLFLRYQTSILFISKVTMGLGFAMAVLFTAGLTRVSFKRFMVISVVGQAFWTAFLLCVGYFLGNLYISINDMFGKVSLTVGIIVIVVLIFLCIRYLRGRLLDKKA